MPRSKTNYWLVVALLLCRLVLGEFAHAAPLPSSADAQDMSHCEEHDQAPDPVAMQDLAPTSQSDGEHPPCCKSGACECPCLHVAALHVSIAVVAVPALRDDNFAVPAVPLPSLGAGNLFRPPIQALS